MDVYIYCSVCNSELEIYDEYTDEKGLTIQVVPCKTCIDEEGNVRYDEGYEDGLKDGRDQGYNEGIAECE